MISFNVLQNEIICGMSVVCEWIDWLRAVEIWGWCNKVYGVHTVHTVHTVHGLHNVRTVHTLHTVYIVHTVHCATVHLVQLCIELCNS